MEKGPKKYIPPFKRSQQHQQQPQLQPQRCQPLKELQKTNKDKSPKNEESQCICLEKKSANTSTDNLKTDPAPLLPKNLEEKSPKEEHKTKLSDSPATIPASCRPDGSLRKERRIRPGYVPQELIPRYIPPSARRLQKTADHKDNPSDKRLYNTSSDLTIHKSDAYDSTSKSEADLTYLFGRMKVGKRHSSANPKNKE